MIKSLYNRLYFYWFFYIRPVEIKIIPWAINLLHKNWKWAFKTKFVRKHPLRLNFVLFIIQISRNTQIKKNTT